MPDYGVTLERMDCIGLITLNRPERWNAFDLVMWDSLEITVQSLEKQCPRAVVITGSGTRAFCAGQDINPDNVQILDISRALETGDRQPAEGLIRRIRAIVDRLCALPSPLIAALNGAAYGGGAELATRCDLRVMDPMASLTFSEVRLGLMPDWGGGVALTRLVGPSRAADIILSARRVEAEEAMQLGLVNRISPPGQSLQEAMDLARAISQNGPRAVRSALAVIRQTPDLPLQQALDLESEKAVDLILSGECIHGIAGFLAKKPPEFPDPE